MLPCFTRTTRSSYILYLPQIQSFSIWTPPSLSFQRKQIPSAPPTKQYHPIPRVLISPPSSLLYIALHPNIPPHKETKKRQWRETITIKIPPRPKKIARPQKKQMPLANAWSTAMIKTWGRRRWRRESPCPSPSCPMLLSWSGLWRTWAMSWLTIPFHLSSLSPSSTSWGWNTLSLWSLQRRLHSISGSSLRRVCKAFSREGLTSTPFLQL